MKRLDLSDWLAMKFWCEKFLAAWQKVTGASTTGGDIVDPGADGKMAELDDARRMIAIDSTFLSFIPCSCDASCQMLVHYETNPIHPRCQKKFEKLVTKHAKSEGLKAILVVRAFAEITLPEMMTMERAKPFVAELLKPYGVYGENSFELRPVNLEGAEAYTKLEAEFEYGLMPLEVQKPA